MLPVAQSTEEKKGTREKYWAALFVSCPDPSITKVYFLHVTQSVNCNQYLTCGYGGLNVVISQKPMYLPSVEMLYRDDVTCDAINTNPQTATIV